MPAGSVSSASIRPPPSIARSFLLVSGAVGEELAVQAMRAGANDYLMKGRLARLVPAVERELRDAAMRREQQQRLHHLAYYDATTGLANRTLFTERLAQLAHAAKRDQHLLAVAVVDLDRFRSINESLGRAAGDALLSQVAMRLAGCATHPDHVARIGADIFAIAHPQVADAGEVARGTRELLRRCFGDPFSLAGNEFRVDARAGIALFPDDAEDTEVLLRHAESAVARAKAGTDRCLFYTEQMTARVAEKLGLENRLRSAIERDEFTLHYQPKVDAATRRITGVEALLRWRGVDGTLVPPVSFIPALEETGLMVEVGEWVLRRAVRDHRFWLDAGLEAPCVAVNVSVLQLHRPDFVAMVLDAVAPCGPAPAIDLEITESLLAGDVEASLAKLTALRGRGLGIAIDDFGTGYSSLAYLARMPVQQIKIDRSFVVEMLDDAHAKTLVATIVTLARSLGLVAVAEGVETEAQAQALLDMGCHQIQGYLISRPVTREALADLLARR
jgi:diguanylate cyclase (GGDEF)-like protein